jgi:hypothetical protein
LDGDIPTGSAQLAVHAYLFIALPLLPTYVPLYVLLLEPHGRLMRVAPFVLLGAIVSAYLAFVVLADPVTVTGHPHGLAYATGVQYGILWAVLYVVAVIGPALLSGYRSIIAFGVLNLVGLIVVGVVYTREFASLWCIYAALASGLVMVHMVRRRRLSDPHRLHGEPLVKPATGNVS